MEFDFLVLSGDSRPLLTFALKAFCETRLGDFSSVGDEVETFELNEFFQEVLFAMSVGQMKNKLPHHDY